MYVCASSHAHITVCVCVCVCVMVCVGHGSIDDIAQMTQWLGNTSLIQVWNSTSVTVVDANTTKIDITPEYVRGTDHYQFAPGVTSGNNTCTRSVVFMCICMLMCVCFLCVCLLSQTRN